jgi:hypothetical protein
MDKQPATRIKVSIEIPTEAKKRIVWTVIEVVGLISLSGWALHEVLKSLS